MKNNPDASVFSEVENADTDLTIDTSKNNEENDDITFQRKNSRRLYNIKKL